jgi:hypothetical protein
MCDHRNPERGSRWEMQKTDDYVSPIHLHALLGVGNFTKVVCVCADRL